jgi:uncharacterized membrane protein (DUF485 family)
MTWLVLTVPELKGKKDLARLRRTITRQKYITLGVVFLLIGAGVVVLVGFFGGWSPTAEIPLLVAAGTPLAVVECWIKAVEARLRKLPASDPAIRAKRDRIIQAWEDEPIPDW